MAYPKWLFRIIRDREIPKEIREVIRTEYRRLTELEKLYAGWDQEHMQPPAASGPSGQPSSGSEPDGLVNGGIPVLITNEMKTQLRACGYTTSQIQDMTPNEAQTYLASR
jgi:hypothetical protein